MMVQAISRPYRREIDRISATKGLSPLPTRLLFDFHVIHSCFGTTDDECCLHADCDGRTLLTTRDGQRMYYGRTYVDVNNQCVSPLRRVNKKLMFCTLIEQKFPAT